VALLATPSLDTQAIDLNPRKEIRMTRADRVALEERQLHRELRLLERRYHTTESNLHFAPLDRFDVDLYPSLAALARRAVAAERRRQRHRPYGAGDHDFWYDLFLMVNAAARAFDPKRHATHVGRQHLNVLVDALVDAAEVTFPWVPGDVWKRHHEGLANTLLFIGDQELTDRAQAQARRRSRDVQEVLAFTIARAEQVHLERLAALVPTLRRREMALLLESVPTR
jgi:hypothetical protein